MQSRPACLVIAGYDPSGGAGVLADIKTLENLGVSACAITTCITFQNESEFHGVEWLDDETIARQLNSLTSIYEFEYVKIGLIRDYNQLVFLLRLLENHNPKIHVIFDPVLKTSSGFDFSKNTALPASILSRLYLITPNLEETRVLSDEEPIRACITSSEYCNVLLKGGHSDSDESNDMLYQNGESITLKGERIPSARKHGSGCVMSSAITGFLSLGYTLEDACRSAKEYTLDFLLSTATLLGRHKGILQREIAAEHA